MAAHVGTTTRIDKIDFDPHYYKLRNLVALDMIIRVADQAATEFARLFTPSSELKPTPPTFCFGTPVLSSLQRPSPQLDSDCSQNECLPKPSLELDWRFLPLT